MMSCPICKSSIAYMSSLSLHHKEDEFFLLSLDCLEEESIYPRYSIKMTLTQETYVRNKRTKPQGKSENYDISLDTASYHTPLTPHKTHVQDMLS